MDRWVGRVAIVTGASAGCGYEITRALVRHGMNVVGCARNVDQIQKLAADLKEEKGSLTAVRCDVSKESDVLSLFDKAKETYGRVDVCINNAGVLGTGTLLTGDTDTWRQVLEVNVLGLAMCTREAAKCFRDLGIDDGHIINVCSTAGHVVSSRMYSASKFMVTAMTAGVRTELRQLNSNVRVSQISPGFIETEFIERAGVSTEEIKKFYNDRPHLEVKDIADTLVYILSAPSHVQIRNVIMSNTQQNFNVI